MLASEGCVAPDIRDQERPEDDRLVRRVGLLRVYWSPDGRTPVPELEYALDDSAEQLVGDEVAPSGRAGSVRDKRTSWNAEGAWSTSQAMLSRATPLESR